MRSIIQIHDCLLRRASRIINEDQLSDPRVRDRIERMARRLFYRKHKQWFEPKDFKFGIPPEHGAWFGGQV